MSDKKDKKLYPQLPSDEQGVEPPPYTPSTAPSSPSIGPSAPLLQHQHFSALQEQQPLLQQQAVVTYPRVHPSYPQHHIAHHPGHVAQHPQASVMSSPLVLMKPPSRIEDLGPKPGVVVCPHCHYVVLTETEPEAGSCTYLSILTLLLLGITSCGCCLLPLCMTSGKDMLHSCPNCSEEIGLFSRLKGHTIPARGGP
ncbi:hypothetical protein DFQ27_008351 [Actinomortierella ambigua]|uniref:LITAF domain-containing protein n=1 Tax=Actinomortierella ambigua TaxID=1343610 RepID=A0A9P6QN32_9FUNG|nr:hypothetical protein DFQ26_007142 [Actinomortierella ambigua]KAG0270336.1 hypothetical protein DFQ27_008351 [Actinomortierella ambigua]